MLFGLKRVGGLAAARFMRLRIDRGADVGLQLDHGRGIFGQAAIKYISKC